MDSSITYLSTGALLPRLGGGGLRDRDAEEPDERLLRLGDRWDSSTTEVSPATFVASWLVRVALFDRPITHAPSDMRNVLGGSGGCREKVDIIGHPSRDKQMR